MKRKMGFIKKLSFRETKGTAIKFISTNTKSNSSVGFSVSGSENELHKEDCMMQLVLHQLFKEQNNAQLYHRALVPFLKGNRQFDYGGEIG